MENKNLNNNSIKEQIAALKVEHKKALKAMRDEHNAALAQIKDKQAAELKEFKNNQIVQKQLAKDTKAQVVQEIAKFNADRKQAFEDFKNSQAKALEEFKAKDSNLVNIYKFQCEQENAYNLFVEEKNTEKLIFDSNEKNKVNKVDLNWKNEVVKFRLNQFDAYHRQEDVLRYDEYLLEQKQKAEIDALTPKKETGDSKNALKDADKEQGNPVAIFFKNLWRDIKVSIQTKPSIIFGLLTLVTGILIGFKVNAFIRVGYDFDASNAAVGIFIFVLELAGMLNMVNGFGMCTSAKLSSVVKATLCTVVITVMGILWIYFVNFRRAGDSSTAADISTTFTVVITCIVTSVIGTIGGYFTYDREALKVRR